MIFLGSLGGHCCSSVAIATDPMRTSLIVNVKSLDSLTIANHYASLRGIPDRCIVTLDKVPPGMTCAIDEMRANILLPLLAELDRRGLGSQTDLIAYSADFPTAIRLDSDFAKIPDHHYAFTPVGSLNGLTTLYQLLGDEKVSYISPRSNLYARPDSTLLMQNPFFGGDHDLFERAVTASDAKDFGLAIDIFEELSKRHPAQWPLRLRIAGLQSLAEQKTDALGSISQLLQDGFALRPMFDEDAAFDSIRSDDAFVKLIAEMPGTAPNRLPAIAFSARTSWGQNGLAVNDSAGGPRYLLSTLLAVTRGRGTTLEEAVEILQRAVDADATGEASTFYFSNSSDVRSTTRMPLVPVAAIALRELGHEVIIDQERLPRGQVNLMGAMLGSANYDWPLARNQLRPGAIVENLTSTSGVLHEDNDQTSMVDLLIGGAAGTSGTVTEPYSLQFKFPTPLLYAYYAAGATLAEAFHLSVESPYQLLIVGDPLCRPFGDQHNELFTLEQSPGKTNALELRLRFWRKFDVAAKKLEQIELFFGGQLAATSPPAQSVRINPAGLPSGWHEVTVVAVSRHPLRMKTVQSIYVLIGEESDCPVLTGEFLTSKNDPTETNDRTISPGDSLGSIRARIDSPGAEKVAIEHLGRRIAETDRMNADLEIPLSVTGYGPVRLTPFALRNNAWIPGKSITIDVNTPSATPLGLRE